MIIAWGINFAFLFLQHNNSNIGRVGMFLNLCFTHKLYPAQQQQ